MFSQIRHYVDHKTLSGHRILTLQNYRFTGKGFKTYVFHEMAVI